MCICFLCRLFLNVVMFCVFVLVLFIVVSWKCWLCMLRLIVFDM